LLFEVGVWGVALGSYSVHCFVHYLHLSVFWHYSRGEKEETQGAAHVLKCHSGELERAV